MILDDNIFITTLYFDWQFIKVRVFWVKISQWLSEHNFVHFWEFVYIYIYTSGRAVIIICFNVSSYFIKLSKIINKYCIEKISSWQNNGKYTYLFFNN